MFFPWLFSSGLFVMPPVCLAGHLPTMIGPVILYWPYVTTDSSMAAPIATAYAATVAVIVTGYYARRQAYLAREKLRIDLFDRRMALLGATIAAQDALDAWSNAKGDGEALKKLADAILPSEFLFPRDGGISKIIKEVRGLVQEARFLSRVQLRNSIAREVALEDDRRVIHIITKELPACFERLKAAMRPYLAFEDY